MSGISEDLKRNILDILRKDGRYSAAAIADMLGEEEQCIAEAVKALEQSGVIIKYTVT